MINLGYAALLLYLYSSGLTTHLLLALLTILAGLIARCDRG
jgi:hypothetical protein